MKVSDALDSNFIHVGDLDGRDWTLSIERVSDENTVKREDGRSIDKPVLYFTGKKAGFVLGTTNHRRCQLVLGNDRATWIGKKITLGPDITECPKAKAIEYGCAILGDGKKKNHAVVPCIRVRVTSVNGITTEIAPLGRPTT